MNQLSFSVSFSAAEMSVMDIEAEREKIQREIAELERSLGAAIPSIDVDILNSGSEDEGINTCQSFSYLVLL